MLCFCLFSTSPTLHAGWYVRFHALFFSLLPTPSPALFLRNFRYPIPVTTSIFFLQTLSIYEERMAWSLNGLDAVTLHLSDLTGGCVRVWNGLLSLVRTYFPATQGCLYMGYLHLYNCPQSAPQYRTPCTTTLCV